MSWRPSQQRVSARWLAIALLAGCGGTTPAVVEDPVATTITLSVASADLTFINETVPLSAIVLDQNGNSIGGAITWASDDETVATVTMTGIVRAAGNGSAEVTATVGAISASATINVQQVATFIAAVSGADQVAVAGNALAEPVVVLAQDAAGTPVDGTTVSFTPNSGDGSVSVGSVVVGADGLASTEWTLGTSFGPQRLVAAIAGAAGTDATILATAFSDTPTPDLVADATISVLRPDPSTLETFRVRNTVRNAGDLASGGYTVRVLEGTTEVASVDLPSLDPSAEELVELQVGPLTAGSHDLTLVIDPDDSILELNEENNEALRSVFVALQTSVSTGTQGGINLALEESVLYRLEVPAGSAALTVALSGGSGDADVFIEEGSRPSDRTEYDDCVAAGPTNDDSCQILDPEGTYHILLNSPQAATSGLTMDITLGNTVAPFDLDLVFVDRGTPSQDSAMVAAAERWMEVLIGDIPDQVFTPQNSIPADQCITGQAEVTEPIDDVRIYVSIAFIDGPLGVLGQARPCWVRHQSLLPIIGLIQFDEADLERIEGDGDMDVVILHEMAHVLGVGPLWDGRGLLESPSVPPAGMSGADTHFRGVRAIAAFDAAGGVNYTGGAKVPVENVAGAGSGDAHWRESVFDEELMTPFIDGGVINPLSAITIESLADLGYGVDVSQADPYAKLFTTAPRVSASSGRKIDLRGDIAEGPIVVVDRDGRIVEIMR